jgi:tetratricopeptide (TPR) repeat protein
LNARVIWFDDAELRRRAGKTSYTRGLGYVDVVVDLCWSPGAMTAEVRGSDEYQVRLWDSRGKLSGDCSCPWGQEGNFCKHCVAVGLAALKAARSGLPAPEPGPRSRAEDAADLRVFLNGLEKTVLVDVLLELAGRDPTVHKLLSLRTKPQGFDQADLYPMVDALKRTWRLGDVALARLCREAADALRTLDTFATDHPAAIRSLYQLTLGHLTAPSYDGQPDGNLATIRDLVARAINGLLAVSRAKPPDPAEFIRWLIDVQITNSRSLGLSVSRFAEILGDEGLTSYWQRLSDLAGDASADDGEDARLRCQRAILRLRESYLVDIVKDIDQLVDLYAEDLSQPERYVRIGETLRAAERFDEAIDWLRRGLAEVPGRRREICDLLVAVYTQTGRPKEAARARLDNFIRDPDAYNYRMLLRAAEAIDAAPYAREQAMTLLRERAALGGPEAADQLVTILVAADEIDDAWAAAQEFECSDERMFHLAETRGKRHPADAIPVYERKVDDALAYKSWSGHQQAVELLLSLQDLHQRAGIDFGGYLHYIKSKYHRRSSLMVCLEEAGL